MISLFKRHKKTYLIKVTAVDLTTSLVESWVMDNIAFNNWAINNDMIGEYKLINTEKI